MVENAKGNSFDFPCKDVVTCVEFCPFEAASQLIAFGGQLRVSIGSCRFQEEDKSVAGSDYQHLRDFHHDTQVVAISWSPETSLEILPRCVRFCTAGVDHKIRLFTSDMKEQDVMELMDGHVDYINALAFEPTEGQLIASVSDDHTCRVWGLDGVQKACFSLKAAGMSACWNSQDPMKLMVAEKRGTIRFYDLLNQQPIMSLDAGHVMLKSADWCPSDPTRVGAAVEGEWMVWDITRSSRAEDSQQAHTEGTQQFRWSRISENLFATTGRPGNQVKVFHMGHHQVPVSSEVPVLGGLTWHAFLPICAVGGDRKIHVWITEA
ncbi:nucleoporin Nup37-like [Patiria miniata]|uniref:Nucleoporin Nup37 n=1 Tax=Patiria miniata TaxID=46514 RepID=A0A914BCD4_PATMI|nr:nucleoporin Nup37-like [Patiria miniata]XP_038073501.1 nucleoporin Nup37-like [Patiria miniata]XP_038073502.1 nucleoporin Nup37-like [Patiria miniata]